MSLAKDMSDLLEEMKVAKFRIVPHGGTRVRVMAPRDNQMTFMSTNPTIRSTIKNARAWARRYGLDDVQPELPAQEEAVVSPSHRRPRATPAEMPRQKAPEPPPQPAPAPEPVVVSPPASQGPLLPEDHPARPLPGAVLVNKGNGVWEEPDRPIDPDQALAMLAYNIENRAVQERLVDSWARTMKDGGWVEEIGDPIRFSDTGKLLDGQKRLLAVIQANVIIKFNVITGLPNSAQDVMDSGQHRSTADQLKINGYRNAMVVASSTRLLWLWDHGSLISNIPSPSNVEVIDYVLHLTGDTVSIEQSASIAASSAARGIIAPSVLAACHYKMSLVDPHSAHEFMEKVSTGANLPPGSPILTLRETMRRRKELRKRVLQVHQIYLVARAWQLWRAGKTAQKLQLPESMTMSAIPPIE